jgi:hypothetical protein
LTRISLRFFFLFFLLFAGAVPDAFETIPFVHGANVSPASIAQCANARIASLEHGTLKGLGKRILEEISDTFFLDEWRPGSGPEDQVEYDTISNFAVDLEELNWQLRNNGASKPRSACLAKRVLLSFDGEKSCLKLVDKQRKESSKKAR